MDRGEKVTKEAHPRENANVLSLLSFFYTIKLFIKGFKKSLEIGDLYEVLKSCDSKKLGDDLEEAWLKDQKANKKPSIVRALWTCHWKAYTLLGVVQLIMKTIMTVCFPEALSKLISYFTPGQTELSRTDAIYYATLVIAINLIALVYNNNYYFYIVELGIKVRTGVCSLLYRKALRLSKQSLSDTSVGKITTIITRDIDGFEMMVEYGHYMWIGVVQTVIICYLIYSKIGTAAFAGVSFFLLIIPFQALIGKFTYALRLRSSKETDQRLEVTQEAFSAIKVIKMYTWEKYFIDQINWARNKELSKLQKIFYVTVLAVVIGALCSKVAFFLFVMTYVWMGNNITAEIVYYIMSCFNDLEYTLGVLMPYGIGYVAQMSAAVTRVEDVLAAEEIPPARARRQSHPKKPGLNMTNITTTIGDKIVLENVSLNIGKGLNILVGHVGSGKTTFLRTILEECKTEGFLDIEGSISYASQEPWLFPASIKNNILFGEDYEEKRYQRVLDICCLTYDLETFIDGDGTLVGDRGVNLSKGQQARINLARAVYRTCDIYLLDDCLAALDAKVSDNIFKQCMQDFLRDKIAIFVTNNFNYIQKADRIILINQQKALFSDKPLASKHLKQFQKTTLNEAESKETLTQNGINSDKPKADKMVYSEKKADGKVPLTVYKEYIKFGGGFLVFSIVLGLFVAVQALTSYSEKMMSNWVTLEQNLSSYADKNSTQYMETYAERTQVLNLFTIAVGAFTALTFVKAFSFFTFIRKASINMHKTMVWKLMNTTVAFFDSHFIGNILTRFSKDLTNIDESLPFTIAECLGMFFVIPSGVILLTTVNILFLGQSLILFAIAYAIRSFYQPTGRNLYRLNCSTRCPMLGHLNATLEGLITIRASKAQKIIRDEYDRHQNLFTSCNYTHNACTAALSFYLELLCAIFVDSIIIQFLLSTHLNTSVGDVGLAITQSFVLTDIIITGLKNLSQTENQMTSVERILEYATVPEEDDKAKGVEPENWPSEGALDFDKVSLAYDGRSDRNMLDEINISLEAGDKLGIVGRTGAGKSSIISSLFRLYPTKGRITIDGVDIQTLPLKFARSKISVIPQDPILFQGSIRDNLDPLGMNTDEEIWRTLADLKLKPLIIDLGIKVDKGSTFSAGQKQLICLARAILRKNKIVVLDEATANVDQETDVLIHEAVRRNFEDCTVIIVAHRLLSVLDCDYVAVLDRGRITEFDSPTKLLENTNSFLHCVVK